MPFPDAMGIVTRAIGGAPGGHEDCHGGYFGPHRPIARAALRRLLLRPRHAHGCGAVILTASASGGAAPYTFTWRLDGTAATGETGG